MAKKYVLIVDDDPDMVETVGMMLESKGYEVGKAYDGIEGDESIKKRAPDLVVLDVMMPKMDGFEVLKRLQANPETRDIPVIMLTAKAQDADIFAGWQSGVSSYLTKPFNPLELITFVKRIFSGFDEYDDGEKTWNL